MLKGRARVWSVQQRNIETWENCLVHANHRPGSASPTLFFPLIFQRSSCKKMGFLYHQSKGFSKVPQGYSNKGVTGFQQFPPSFWNPSLLASRTHMAVMTAASEHLIVFQPLNFTAPLLSSPAVTALVYSRWWTAVRRPKARATKRLRHCVAQHYEMQHGSGSTYSPRPGAFTVHG